MGSTGGVVNTHAGYQQTHYLLNFPTSKEIAEIMVAVGLAQNFSAIRALSIEGIQRGHMNLHAKNIAMQAGVPERLVAEVVEYMKVRNKITIETAKNYMTAHHIYSVIRKHEENETKKSLR